MPPDDMTSTDSIPRPGPEPSVTPDAVEKV